jgi:hypothetical protein
MLRINNFLGLAICKCRSEFITEICLEILRYNNNEMCQHKNFRGLSKYKNIDKLNNSNETNKTNVLWPPCDNYK